MDLIKLLVIMSLISVSLSLNIRSLRLKRMANNPQIRYSRQNTIPDMGIPLDWIEESPVDQQNEGSDSSGEDNGFGDFPLPDGIPNESDDENGDEDNEENDELRPRSDELSSDTNVMETESSGMAPTMGSVEVPKHIAKLVEICDKPVIISAANRYTNSTVRLFRDKNYWDLLSLPDKIAFTSDKMSLSAPMAPIPPRTSIVSILEGSKKLKGKTYKFQKQFFWTWDEEGKQERGGKGGEYWDELPKGGFDTMFHNGNATKPMIIAFKDDLVYYLTTNGEELEFFDSEGKKGGKFKENFPPALTAAFTWSVGEPPRLKVYLFRDNEYCMRDVNSPKTGKDCDEWRETAELFGCLPKEPPTTFPPPTTPAPTEAPSVPPPTTTEAPPPPPPPPQPVMESSTKLLNTTTPRSGSSVSVSELTPLLVFFLIFFIRF